MNHVLSTPELVAIFAGLLLIAAATKGVADRFRLPFTVALVLVGIGLKELGEIGPSALSFLADIRVAPELILYVFLPTLVFESAYNMDSRLLRRNLAPVLTLAIPGLIVSTGLIGVLVWAATPLDLPAALLLGAILSATDPVAVISLFKQMGAPKRLTILVEGESLFNDATALVAAKILVGVVAVGYFSWDAAASGVGEFFRVFLGGIAVGWLAGFAVGWVLGRVRTSPQLEISLTTVLAYGSFLLAEHWLHVSGVMAVVAAGVVLGGWGRAKISPSVVGYMDHFWEHMAFVANVLIFLLVGLSVDVPALWATLPYLPWVILAMLLSRAALVYGLMPLVGRLPGSQPVGMPYQTVMFWGGLRGAIALAIVLSLPAFPNAELFMPLTTGAVLFTLLAQGLTIEKLMHRLGLDRPPLADRLALLERDLAAQELTLERTPDLLRGGQFAQHIAARLERKCRQNSAHIRHALADLRQKEMGRHEESMLLYLRAFSEEQAYYQRLYNNGHLSEGAYRELLAVLLLQIDAIRYQGRFEHVRSNHFNRLLEHGLFRLIDRLDWGWLAGFGERLRTRRIVRNYEEVLAHYQGNGWVLASLDRMATDEGIPAEVVEEVRGRYRHWNELARTQLDGVSAQFPEFVSAMQERLSQRIALLAVQEATEAQVGRGLLPPGIGEAQMADVSRRLEDLRTPERARLRVNPAELLGKVPFFRQLSSADFSEITPLLKRRSVTEHEAIVSQGEAGDALYLIARGVVRVLRSDDGEEHALGTLLAGDFFGEQALLHDEPRNATCRAVTPCVLYQLQRDDFAELRRRWPAIEAAVTSTDQARRAEA
ncbi:MAG: cation:proton antiporter [Gammaproteobacteria bacterium]|nr:cation:proton antiporter [Gammaproteobacteria bacterium]MBU1646568.1 cation:proton antiporter [Gammaproteobacteria bacterium]MBU1972825.1 cation:proton antiporter [Gammaproteobacteria bacterium]